ncbi:CobD/CbiB family cobalamin biosynthesis protein [Haloarcula montana]|uniref:CobD/CbiB family cobalamin biosynthesis protein n=1 Tax=Haloarcula montana TaxID=3111776 RepID=UPI003DA7F482
MSTAAGLAVLVAAALEGGLGEPPTRWHPVAWFGVLVGAVDRPWDQPLAVGALAAAALPLAAAAGVGTLVVGAGTVTPLLGVGVAGAVLFLTTSLRRLLSAANAVARDSDRDVAAAREGLLALAGRDAADLSPGLLRSAAVESAAENLADGLVAPLGAFALAVVLAPAVGLPPLPAGVGAAAWVKAVNTMDSMLGYRSKLVGTPAARLDDAVMWLPARASALLLAVAFLDWGCLWRASRWLDRVPSPNSGWPMGVAAAALDSRLEKPGVYVLNADCDLPSVAGARRGIRRVGAAGVLAYVVAGVIAWS